MEDTSHAFVDESHLTPLLEMIQPSSNASMIRTVVLKVLSHPEIYCGFDQVKAKCSASSSASPDILATLDLFSYGVYQDYLNTPTNYLSLNETHLSKLKQLTILTLMQQACQQGLTSLSYQDMRQALQMNDASKELEPLLIAGLYARIWNGRLCQKTQHFLLSVVPPCMARDVPLSSIGNLVSDLQGLMQRLQDSSVDLETAYTQVTQQLEQDQQYWKSVKERKQKVQSQISSNSTSGSVRVAGMASGSAASARRSSASRQSKRSRGGLGGSFTEPFQRF